MRFTCAILLFYISYHAGALTCRREARSTCLWNLQAEYSGINFDQVVLIIELILIAKLPYDELAKHYSASIAAVFVACIVTWEVPHMDQLAHGTQQRQNRPSLSSL